MKITRRLVPPLILVVGLGIGFIGGSKFEKFKKSDLIIKCNSGEIFKYYPSRERIIFVAFKDVVMDDASNAYEIDDRIYANKVVSNVEGVSWFYNKKDGELRTTFLDDNGKITKQGSASCKHYRVGFGPNDEDPKNSRPLSQV